MKILKDNYNNINTEEVKELKSYPRKTICEHCQSELEYEKSDVRIGHLGCAYIDCPLCKRKTFLEDDNDIILTVDNVEFPTHFYHFSKETGAKDCCNNEEVVKRIREAIDYFRKNKDEYLWHTAYGNLCIYVHRYEGDENYEVVVTDNYYETNIDFELEDFKGYFKDYVKKDENYSFYGLGGSI